VVAAMGDSLTDQRSHGGKYLEHLAEKCPESRFDSYGVGGNMVNQMRKRFARDILGSGSAEDKPHYTHVLILGGINDICSDESAARTNDKIKADLSAMYKMAHNRGIEVIALTLPPWGGFTRYYNKRRARSTFDLNRWIKQQETEQRVEKVVDIFPVLSCGEPEELCEPYGWPDKVHWSKKGHGVVGKVLHERVFSNCL
jgi:lysophospholipase L1-like esterase